MFYRHLELPLLKHLLMCLYTPTLSMKFNLTEFYNIQRPHHPRTWCRVYTIFVCGDSFVSLEHSEMYWKTLMSDAASRALRVFGVHAVRAVVACSGLTVQLCQSTAPSQRRTLPPVDMHLAPPIQTDRTWTWALPTRAVPALRVDLTKTSVQQLTRQTYQC